MQSTREVASGVVNLGSTCYMNAVLQALAHSPELCSAIECEPHYVQCPIALSNEQRKIRNDVNGASNDESMKEESDLNDLKSEQKNTKKGTKRRKPNGNSNALSLLKSNNDDTFCVLCEIEKHLIKVHDKTGVGEITTKSNNGHGTSSGNSSLSSSNRVEPVAPSVFVNGFIRHVTPKSFKLGVQEDSHEFLRLLIDAMQKSCIQKGKGSSNSSSNNSSSNNESNSMLVNNTVKKEEKEDDNNNHKDEIQTNVNRNEYAFRLFRGKVESIVTCSYCKSISSTIDPIEDIGLDVTSFPSPNMSSGSSGRKQNQRGRISPSPSSLSDVTSALEKFVTLEKLDSGYKCETCGRVGQATKQSRLASVPPILTLHLKRFRYGSDGRNGFSHTPVPSRRRNNELASLLGNGDMGGTSGSAKIEGHIRFNLILDIRPYLSIEKQNEVGKSMLCRLFAVVVHAGKNSHSGHYICYVRNIAKNDWWKMDDSKVMRVSQREVIAAEAYMLFYRVMDHPVTVELRNKEKAMKEAAAATAAKVKDEMEELKVKEEKKTVSTINTSMSTDNTNMLINKRKREEPKYKSGDDWARAVTNLPDSWIPVIRRIQDALCEHLNFKAEYFRVLEDEAKAGKLGDGPSIGIGAEDIQGGINGLRAALKDMLIKILPDEKEIVHQLLTSVELNSMEAETKSEKENILQNGKGGGGDSSNKETNDLLFPVYESNDTML